MKQLIMIAREITQKEIKLGIGIEPSGTRLSPIYKSLDLNIPLLDGKLFVPSIPIDPFEGTPLLLLSLIYIPHHESVLFTTPSIIEKVSSQKLQPTKIISDPGKGTGAPIIAASIEAKDDDILILAPCDQFQSPAVHTAVSSILNKIEKKGYLSGTILAEGTKNPAFSYVRVKDDKIVEFTLKGVEPKPDMFAETMIVCVRAGYLKSQILQMKNVTLKQLKKFYPYPDNELEKVSKILTENIKLIENCKSIEEYMKKCPFTDFSRDIHKLLISNMTYAIVKYGSEWDDLGDWLKIYNSHLYPKDNNGNIIFSKANLISYTNCEKSIIANFTTEKVIVNGLKNRIFAAGSRGIIDLPLDLNPQEFKKEVVKLQM